MPAVVHMGGICMSNFEELLKKARSGDAAAQNELGDCYKYGDGVGQDVTEAKNWYEKAAEQGVVEAQRNLGFYYIFGYEEGKEEKGLEYFLKAASQGDAEAQHTIGKFFKEGTIVSQNDKSAFYWYSKAADQGYANAQYELGESYYFGSGVEQNYEEAIKWFLKAAEQDQVDAQLALGYCYYLGNGVAEDYEEAAEWFHKAAEQGLAEARYLYGDCFFEGEGVEQDYSEAVYWYREAAEQGYPQAQNDLGGCYLNGTGVEEDHAEAIVWFRKAAEQGVAESQCLLGAALEAGAIVEQNLEEAVGWYGKSAEQGNKYAEFKLGNCYLNGIGLEKDEAKALELFSQAAEQGHEEAQEILIDCYANGIGTRQDGKKAGKLIRKFAEQGNAECRKRFAMMVFLGVDDYSMVMKMLKDDETATDQINKRLYKIGFRNAYDRSDINLALDWMKAAANEGDPTALEIVCFFYTFDPEFIEDTTDAMDWYKKAAEAGNCDMEVLIANCYSLGVGVEKDEAEALRWYQKATDHGDPVALVAVANCFLEGKGVEKDEKKGVEIILKAAKEGSCMAMLLAGCMYLDGQYLEKDLNFSFEFLKGSLNDVDQDFVFALSSCSMAFISFFGIQHESFRQEAEGTLLDAGKSYPSAELFLHILKNDWSDRDWMLKLIELCEKHKRDSGGWAYYLLSLLYSSASDGLAKDLVSQNNAKAYYFLRMAVEYSCDFLGLFSTMADGSILREDLELSADYDMIDAKLDFDKGVDFNKLGKAVETVLSASFTKMSNPQNMVNKIVATKSMVDFAFSSAMTWDIERMPNFSVKVRNEIRKSGGIYDYNDYKKDSDFEKKKDKEVNMVKRHVRNLGKDINMIPNDELKAIIDEVCRECGDGTKERVFNKLRYGEQSFGDMKDGGGDFFDQQKDRERKPPEQQFLQKEELDRKELLSKVRQAVMLLDQDDYVRKWVKNKPAAGTCILARALNQGKGFAFDKNDIIRILGETESFSYDISAISEALFDETVTDKEICALIGIDHPSYSRTKEKTLIPLIRNYFKMVFPEIRENGDEVEIVSGGSSDNYGKATSCENN